MPNQISSLGCITHRVKIKRTDCKAVVSVLPGQVLGPERFQLSIHLAEVHLPRMWGQNTQRRRASGARGAESVLVLRIFQTFARFRPMLFG
ncbi:protein mono-ADP-ribosyltransferase PARP4-like [Takifugu flavidus]|uniref:protein mono-ADP-ribosyltransferase PARP4-like n=1 Tax=Takifugu flavidus TaxID=433684 RepID=UPI002544AEE5|nr:protein mono-ADP-ribosyltransferase PARP4-like [Takifugu flavidus]